MDERPGYAALATYVGLDDGHTMHWGHRTAYATDNRTDRGAGKELHIEHIAADLKDLEGKPMEIANCYRVWRRGVERGLWRNGTAEEGQRRLYLTGKVPRFKGEDEAIELSVQTIFPYEFTSK